MSKKNRFRGLFSGEKGQRTFNYAYSIGASVVILGALFKLLHVPGADFMLILGMGTEAVIFFLSAFDEPAKDYKWETVFPVLDNPEAEAPDFSHREGAVGGGTTVIGGAAAGGLGGGTIIIGGGAMPAGGAEAPAAQQGEGGSTVVLGGGGVAGAPATPGSAGLSADEARELSEATERYVRQLNDVSEQLARLQQVTSTLVGTEGSGYAEQMQSLARNIQGLNTIYEIQLKSVSSQLDTIERVNAGLNQIRALYENGTNDSFRIRQETEHMTQTLAQLNQIYERMLQAMTVNMGYQPASAYPQRPAAPQQPAAQPYAPAPQAPQYPQPPYGQQA